MDVIYITHDILVQSREKEKEIHLNHFKTRKTVTMEFRYSGI